MEEGIRGINGNGKYAIKKKGSFLRIKVVLGEK